MANVYSRLLASGQANGTQQTVYNVPAGFVTIVSDIGMYCYGSTYKAVPGFLLYGEPDNALIMGRQAPHITTGELYHWRGHQVLETDGYLFLELLGSDLWSYRISGYELTLP